MAYTQASKIIRRCIHGALVGVGAKSRFMGRMSYLERMQDKKQMYEKWRKSQNPIREGLVNERNDNSDQQFPMNT